MVLRNTLLLLHSLTLTHVARTRSCRVTEDVCAYPTGDKEAYDAVRSLALWRGNKDDACVSLMPLCALCVFHFSFSILSTKPAI